MQKVIQSRVIGELKQDANFEDWWKVDAIPVKFFDGLPLPVTYMDFVPECDLAFLEDADSAMERFLGLTSDYRLSISDLVFGNLKAIREAVDYPYWSKELREISDPYAIWQFVRPSSIEVSRRICNDMDVYVSVSCYCSWEEEHGLLLVFRQGKQLTRVSQVDGDITDADANGVSDEEDLLLSLFRP